MPSTSISPWHVCYYPIPNTCYYSHKNLHLPHSNRRRLTTTCLSFNNQTHFPNSSLLNLTATNSCSKEQENENNNSNPNQNHSFLDQIYYSIDTNNHSNHTQITQIQEDKEETVCEVDNFEGISSNMWWVDFKAVLGQRINLEGIVSSLAVVARDRHLALPHVSVRDIRYIDWAELKRKGFRGVVFDKDNTITVPYSLTLWGPLGSSLDRCKSVFGNDIAVLSNSAGLHEYDPDGRKARALECSIGIKVIKHRVKKPAGTAEEIEKHFGCESSLLIMVGDRPFTDVVFGNRNGFLTFLTEPLSLAEEPFIVKQNSHILATTVGGILVACLVNMSNNFLVLLILNIIFRKSRRLTPTVEKRGQARAALGESAEVRKLEVALVNLWCRRGLMPIGHRLLPHPLQCVNDPPPL